MEDGAVDAALSREELSVVDTVFVLDAPLPLNNRQPLDIIKNMGGNYIMCLICYML